MSSSSKTSKTTEEEPKQSLPVGHPKAGYVGPDLSFQDGAGTLPDAEKQWTEAVVGQVDEEKKAVEEHEDATAKEEAAELAKQQEEAQKQQEADAASTSSSATKTTSRSSS